MRRASWRAFREPRFGVPPFECPQAAYSSFSSSTTVEGGGDPQIEALVELVARPDQDVLGNAQAAERSIAHPAIPQFRGSVVRNYYHEVVVTVGSRIASCSRTEQVDPHRMIGLDKTPNDLGEYGIASRGAA